MVVARRDGRIVTPRSYPAHAPGIMQRALTLNPERLSDSDTFGGGAAEKLGGAADLLFQTRKLGVVVF